MVAVLCPCRVLGLVCPRVSQIASFRQLRSRPHRKGKWPRFIGDPCAAGSSQSRCCWWRGYLPRSGGRDDTPEHRPVSPGRRGEPLPGRHRGYLTPMSDSEKSVRACQAASWFGAVQVGLESGRDLPALPRRRRTASRGAEPGGTCAGGDRGLGPGPPAFASGRPVSPSHSPARFAPVREVPPSTISTSLTPLLASSAQTSRP